MCNEETCWWGVKGSNAMRSEIYQKLCQEKDILYLKIVFNNRGLNGGNQSQTS